MKLMKVLAVALLFIGLTACSGGSSFNPEKCKQLEEKMHSGDKLTESDYNEMIDQMGGAIEVLSAKEKEIGEDKDKQSEFVKTDEAKQLMTAVLGFGFYLDSHKSELTPGNLKKLEALQKRFKELDEQK